MKPIRGPGLPHHWRYSPGNVTKGADTAAGLRGRCWREQRSLRGEGLDKPGEVGAEEEGNPEKVLEERDEEYQNAREFLILAWKF